MPLNSYQVVVIGASTRVTRDVLPALSAAGFDHEAIKIITKTNLNHPYMMFLNMDDVYIMFLIPFGRERKQADINAYYNSINNASNIEKMAIYLLIEKTIIIRKKGIIESNQFSLIQCSNISNCIRRYHEIDKMHINNNEKIKLKEKAREFYLNKAIEFIKTFFILLDNKNYDEAYNFLKGNDTNYFGKQRLNTFFKNTKSIKYLTPAMKTLSDRKNKK